MANRFGFVTENVYTLLISLTRLGTLYCISVSRIKKCNHPLIIFFRMLYKIANYPLFKPFYVERILLFVLVLIRFILVCLNHVY